MNFKPLDQLSSSVDWPLWRQKFDIDLTATEKSQSEEKLKIATLLACIGDEGIHPVYNSFSSVDFSSSVKLLYISFKHFTAISYQKR
ncbi:unnamed protein product [Callosobruchus maculatus]|uniref:Uncharacterized protein n=1 Tax=Callosobruchus maculatus TaxID=64391 RepID=A0A653CVW4_CALMS|nr:unnamed protein product [Callosobruchus maculatus]